MQNEIFIRIEKQKEVFNMARGITTKKTIKTKPATTKKK